MVRSDLNTGVSTELTINIDTVKLCHSVDLQTIVKIVAAAHSKCFHSVAPWYLLYEPARAHAKHKINTQDNLLQVQPHNIWVTHVCVIGLSFP